MKSDATVVFEFSARDIGEAGKRLAELLECESIVSSGSRRADV